MIRSTSSPPSHRHRATVASDAVRCKTFHVAPAAVQRRRVSTWSSWGIHPPYAVAFQYPQGVYSVGMDYAVIVDEHHAGHTHGGHDRAGTVVRCTRPVGFVSPMPAGTILMSASPAVALDADLLRRLDLRPGSVR